MRRRIKLMLLVVGLLGAGLLHAPLAAADVNDFTINNMTVDYTLGTADPQGTLDVSEQLSVQFTDYNHGILRALPQKYNGSPLHLHVISVSRDGHSEPYTTYTSNGNEVLKIGNANSTITGLHHYDIKYDVRNVVRIVGDKAELDWNVNGTEWQQPFEAVQATLHLQASMYTGAAATTCYTGAFGSKSSNCLVAHDAQDVTITTDKPLTAGETLTFNTPLPVGSFSKPSLKDKLADYGPELVAAVGIPVVVFILSFGVWLRRGRDVRGRGTIIPEYTPPDGLKPAEIDVILHNKLGKNAISATIIDLAIRGYLKIQESETNGVLGIGKHKTYSFVQGQAPPGDTLNAYEGQVFAGLFETGSAVDISSLRAHFYKTSKIVQKVIPKNLADAGYFSRDPSRAGNVGHVLGMIIVFGAIGGHPRWDLLVGLVISGLIIIVFASLMPRRTTKGAAAKDSIEGLKLYLNTAEKDRIAMLQSPNAPYAPQSTEPVKTVKLFEKLLPYAMVLGVEKQWAEQFQSIYTTPPDWYGGNWSTFNAVYLASSLNQSVSAMNSSFAAPSSSGSGSGGFSGGGGGGGGGGGW